MKADSAGLLRCARYAFAPNPYSCCGPERQKDLTAYLSGAVTDQGLSDILHGFETLISYLRLIAGASHIADPFDPRVVEAYWIGNRLLNGISPRQYTDFVTDGFGLKRKIKPDSVSRIRERVSRAAPFHTAHVVHIFVRTGHRTLIHTASTMDACRIGWGEVTAVRSGSHDEIRVRTRPVIPSAAGLELGLPVIRIFRNPFLPVRPGDLVTTHWGYVCDRINRLQMHRLEALTNRVLGISGLHPGPDGL